MPVINLAGYKFVSLDALDDLKATLDRHCRELELKGTILLSFEGINIVLAQIMRRIKGLIIRRTMINKTSSRKIPVTMLNEKAGFDLCGQMCTIKFLAQF